MVCRSVTVQQMKKSKTGDQLCRPLPFYLRKFLVYGRFKVFQFCFSLECTAKSKLYIDLTEILLCFLNLAILQPYMYRDISTFSDLTIQLFNVEILQITQQPIKNADNEESASLMNTVDKKKSAKFNTILFCAF